MKVEFLNPFIAAAASVLQQEVGTDVSRGPIRVQKGLFVSSDVTVLISLVGRVQGTVLLYMSYETAQALVSAILGQAFDAFDELAQSGIAELANVITGLSSTKLAEVGYASIISVPMLIIGKGSRVSTLNMERISIPLITNVGEIGLDLALCENPDAPVEFASYTANVSAFT
jgi:chemotaxis protein CheX